MIAARQFTTAREMREHYRDLHRKTFGTGQNIVYLPWAKAGPDCAELVAQFKEVETAPPYKARPGETGAAAAIAHVAAKYDLTPEDILGVRRFKVLLEARAEAMILVYRANPKWGLPRLAKVFNRDHTTLLYILRKYGARS